jgi:hypothetical protein
MVKPLLVQAVKAYLDPLLKKHAADTLITFEDLTASWKAATAILDAAADNSDDEEMVRKNHAFFAAYAALERVSTTDGKHPERRNWNLQTSSTLRMSGSLLFDFDQPIQT